MIAIVDVPTAAYLTEQFPTEIHYTSVSISYSIGAALIGVLDKNRRPHLQLNAAQPG